MKFTQFIKNGTVRKLIGTNLWLVQDSFEWYIDYESKKGIVEVEKNFITDFGSVPRLLWWVFNPTEYIAFILHDKLYCIKKIENSYIKREIADQILYEALLVEGCQKWKAKLIYLGVRIGGWVAWNNKTLQSDEEE